MHVPLDADATKGLQYVKERLMLVRAMQDRCNELRLKANRALSDVWQEHLIAKHEQTLKPSTDGKARVADIEGERMNHALLVSMVKAQSQLLSRTAMDIRLLSDLTKEQIRIGEIDPHVAGMVEEKTVADIAASTTEVAPGTTVTGAAIIGKQPWPPEFGGSAGTPTPPSPSKVQAIETVDLGGGSGIMESGREQPLPRTDAVDLDSLFEDLNGQTVAGRPF